MRLPKGIIKPTLNIASNNFARHWSPHLSAGPAYYRLSVP